MEPAATPLDPVTSTYPSLSELHDCGYISESTCSLYRPRTGAIPGVGYVLSELRTSLVSEKQGEKGVHRGGVERARRAQRPREGPAPLGETQTSDIGMHPRTPTWMPTPRVRD